MSEKYLTGPTSASAGTARLHGRQRSPAEARGTVRRLLSEQARAQGTVCTSETLSDALLVASELTTNGVLHGGGITDFDVEVVGQDLYLSVSDRERPHPVTLSPTDPHGHHRRGGRGWPVVCRLSHTVRIADLPTGGKRVTAVIPLRGLVRGGRDGTWRAGRLDRWYREPARARRDLDGMGWTAGLDGVNPQVPVRRPRAPAVRCAAA